MARLATVTSGLKLFFKTHKEEEEHLRGLLQNEEKIEAIKFVRKLAGDSFSLQDIREALVDFKFD